MNRNKTTIALVSLTLLCATLPNADCADTASPDPTRCVIGHFTLPVPKGWNAFSASDKVGARSEFASEMAPGLTQYKKAGAPPPRMGQFEIFQKPPDGQIIAWTLLVPDQTDFLKEILKKEDTEFQKRKNLAGQRLKGGFCRLVKIGTNDVVRVDVEMADGGKSTNLEFWSPKHPGLITTLMVGVRANRSEQTQKDYDTILASLRVDENPKAAD